MKPVSELRLCDIASSSVSTVAADSLLEAAIPLFVEKQISSLVVVDGCRPVGMLTERDLLRLMCSGVAVGCLVSEVMSAPPVTAIDELDFSAAQLMMSNRGIRHLILVDHNGHLKGVASETDFRRFLGHELFEAIQSLTAVMDQSGELFNPQLPLTIALKTLAARGLGYLVAGRDGRAEGILTERDVPRLLIRHVDPAAVSLGDVMSQPLHTVLRDVSVAYAAERMENCKLRQLVVVAADGHFAGVVSQHRILERLGVVLMEESRKHLEGRLGIILEATGVGSWEYDHRREVMTRSAALNRVLNFSPDKVYESLDEILHRIDPGDRERVASAFRNDRTQATEQFSIEYLVVASDGTMRWMSSRGRVIEWESDGSPRFSAGVAMDIHERKSQELARLENEARFRGLIENLPLPVGYTNAREELVFINHHFTEMFGYVLAEVPTVSAWAEVAYPDRVYRDWARGVWDDSLQAARASGKAMVPVEYSIRCKDATVRVVEITGIPLGDGLLTSFIDVTERRQQQALLLFSNAILQHISIGAPLPDVLDFIVREIEDLQPDMLCSVLLLDDSGRRLHNGAGPSLPVDYCRAIDGVEIGPAVGSCGTAAYRKEMVFVADIATDPLWANFKELALGFGLAACWSSPIFSSEGKVLGTFAVYWPKPTSEIMPAVRRYVEAATVLAAIAIESRQRDASLRAMLDELRRWQQMTLGREGRVLELKREVNLLLKRLGESPRYGSVAGESGPT